MKVNMPKGKKARIEMLPLIDIVFLLLVFFIYAMLSMAVHHGLPVELPVSSAVRLDKEKQVLSITINAGANIFLDKEPVALEALTNVLKEKSRGHKQSGVLLFADRNVSYQELFRVLDRIKLAGLDKISLQAEKDF